MTAREALRETERALAAAGVPDPGVDAEWLVAHVLGTSRTGVHTADGDVDAGALRTLVQRRVRREPLAYILGEWGFRRLVLKTDARALVPRPETEIVVERCLAQLSGLEAPHARVTAVDASPDALALARENAKRLGLAVELRHGGFGDAAAGWDLVVSNPPYIAPGELERLEPEVRDWEPREALVGEGLHEELARVARTTWLVLEVGDGQAPEVAGTLERLGYADVAVTADLAGRERVVEGRRP